MLTQTVYTICPSREYNNVIKKLIGGGCRSEITVVPLRKCARWFNDFTTWKVVEQSKPVDISSMKKAFTGPTGYQHFPCFHIINL